MQITDTETRAHIDEYIVWKKKKHFTDKNNQQNPV
jgi:hypothetical protein